MIYLIHRIGNQDLMTDRRGKNMKHVLMVTGCIFLSACSAMSDKAATIKDIDGEMVKKLNCNFLGDVSITSRFEGQSFAAGVNSAKNIAREDAADKGASHILWTDTERGYVTSVKGKAYDCNKTKNPR